MNSYRAMAVSVRPSDGAVDVSLRNDLIAAIQGWEIDLPDLEESTSLIRSGVFDSLALFNLVVWIEEKSGAPLDPTTFDFVNELDTVADIIKFVKRHRVYPAAGDTQVPSGRLG